MAEDSVLFHDGEHLFVIERDSEGEATNTRVLNMSDGTVVEAKAFTPLLKNRLIRTHGGTLLLAERDGFASLSLRQYDVLARKDRWRKTFVPGSLVLETEEPLAGVVQPDGVVLVFDLESGKEVLKATMKPEHLKKVESVFLLRDATGFYLGCRRPRGKNVDSVKPNVAAECGLRGTDINGWLYCFGIDGKERWSSEHEDQSLIVSQFRSLSIVLLSARLRKRAAPDKAVEGLVQTRILHKDTGKPLFDRVEGGTRGPCIQAINADERTGVIEVLREGPRLRIEPDER